MLIAALAASPAETTAATAAGVSGTRPGAEYDEHAREADGHRGPAPRAHDFAEQRALRRS